MICRIECGCMVGGSLLRDGQACAHIARAEDTRANNALGTSGCSDWSVAVPLNKSHSSPSQGRLHGNYITTTRRALPRSSNLVHRNHFPLTSIRSSIRPLRST